MSVDLGTKFSSRNFSQKTNRWGYFSFLTTRQYLKIEIEIQVSSTTGSSGQICSFIFFGRSYDSTILYWDLLTFSSTALRTRTDYWKLTLRSRDETPRVKFVLQINYHCILFMLNNVNVQYILISVRLWNFKDGGS